MTTTAPYEIVFCRYHNGRSRMRTEHRSFPTFLKAAEWATDFVWASNEADHASHYSVNKVYAYGQPENEVASVGWETSEEWHEAQDQTT